MTIKQVLERCLLAKEPALQCHLIWAMERLELVVELSQVRAVQVDIDQSSNWSFASKPQKGVLEPSF